MVHAGSRRPVLARSSLASSVSIGTALHWRVGRRFDVRAAKNILREEGCKL